MRLLLHPWFYPRDGTRVFWLPFAAHIVGIDRTDEYLKSLRLARVCARDCRGVSYSRRADTLITADMPANSSAASSDEHALQERGDRTYLVRIDRMLHRVLVPLDVVAECFQPIA
jgi:hypothetical protein